MDKTELAEPLIWVLNRLVDEYGALGVKKAVDILFPPPSTTAEKEWDWVVSTEDPEQELEWGYRLRSHPSTVWRAVDRKQAEALIARTMAREPREGWHVVNRPLPGPWKEA